MEKILGPPPKKNYHPKLWIFQGDLKLVVSDMFFYFHPKNVETTEFDTIFFELDWNHQLWEVLVVFIDLECTMFLKFIEPLSLGKWSLGWCFLDFSLFVLEAWEMPKGHRVTSPAAR